MVRRGRAAGRLYINIDVEILSSVLQLLSPFFFSVSTVASDVLLTSDGGV